MSIQQTREAVRDLYRRWEVPLHLREPERDEIDSGCRAPTASGGILLFRHKPIAVVCNPEYFRTYYDCCALIHELAHVVIDKHPSFADEVHSPMLAIESVMRDRCEIPRVHEHRWMDSFSLGDIPWEDAPTLRQSRVIVQSHELAIKAGLLTKTGRLTFRRRA